MNVLVTCKGTRPMLMHNGQSSSPLNPYAKAMKKISSKRKKTEDDYFELARLGFESALYFDPAPSPNKNNNNKEGYGPYMPAQNLFMSLRDGARIIKKGKDVERGVVACDFMLPIIYNGARSIKDLWGDGESEFVDIRPVSVGRQKVDRCRPIFKEWAIEAEFIIDTKVIDYDQFVEIAKLAGQMVGIGDYRLMYGRYETICSPK